MLGKDLHSKDKSNQRIPFSCENIRFKTNTKKGFPHGACETKGSVFKKPLVNNGGWTLWLEHILELKSKDELYWLMWYNPKGLSTISGSSVFKRADLACIGKMFAEFIP